MRRPFWIYFFKKKIKKNASSIEKKQPIHMRYHFFVHHEWFLQNLGKEAVRTNMHTTVSTVYIKVWVDNKWPKHNTVLWQSYRDGIFLHSLSLSSMPCRLWQYRLWIFKLGDTKLYKYLIKNEQIQRKKFYLLKWKKFCLSTANFALFKQAFEYKNHFKLYHQQKILIWLFK